MSKNEFIQMLIENGFVLTRLKGKAPFEVGWRDRTETVPASDFGPNDNVGLMLGGACGIVDVDIDDPNALRIADDFLPPTALSFGRKSNLNSHKLYTSPNAGKTTQRQIGGKTIAELRANGSQTMIPPSVHPDGEDVEFCSFGDPAEVDWNDLQRCVDELAIATVIEPYWKPGGRHHCCLALLGVLRRSGWPKERSEAFIKAVVKAFNDEEREDRLACVETTYKAELVNGNRRLAEIIGDMNTAAITKWIGLKTEQKADKGVSNQRYKTDAACAEVFSDCYRTRLLYCDFYKSWFSLDRGVHVAASDIDIQGLVLDYGNELKSTVHESDLGKFTSSSSVRAIISLAKSMLAIKDDEFDTDDNLLGCQNGVLNLATGKFSQTTETIVTRRVATVYDPNAKCPQFLRFLDEIFEGDKDMVAYLKRCIGYTLQGGVQEQGMFLCIGSGRNGKSTLLTVINKLFGDYAGTLPMATLMQTKSDSTKTYDLAKLKGKRFVVCQEGEAGNKMAEAQVKLLTGGDKIPARQIYGKPEEFWPNHKLWLGTNERPRIEGTNEAIWRRLKDIIPFPVFIEDSKVDPELTNKLATEFSGILNFAIEGYQDWKTQGLKRPASVVKEWLDYRNEEDTVEGFIEVCCLKDKRTEATTAELHKPYVSWCNDSGYVPLSITSFGKNLGLKGYKKLKGRVCNGWGGLYLIKPEEQMLALARQSIPHFDKKEEKSLVQ